jgi:hypothetical protein
LLTKPELSELGRELSSLGAHRLAADAHGLAGDLEAQTAALVEAGAIERLEAVFDADESRQRAERDRQRTLARALDLERTGQRRAALALVSDRPRGFGHELADIEQRIKSRRVSGALVHLELEGERRRFALGARVTLGRSHSSITVASPAVSREHLEIWWKDGSPVVADVSKNGTTLRGVPLEGTLAVHARLDLVLGGQVPVTLEPDARFGVRLTVLEDTFLIPLAPLVTRVGEVVIGSDDWVELVAKAPSAQAAAVYLDAWYVSEAVQLCVGDEFRSAPNGPVVLKVVR